MKKGFLLFLSFVILLCSCSLLPQAVKITITYTPGNVEMHAGQDVVVSAVISPPEAVETVDLSYNSEDDTIATVDFTPNTIIVHGMSPGVTRVHSRADGQQEFSFLVTVAEEYVAINLDKNAAVLCSGQQMTLEASLEGSDPEAYDRITWGIEGNNTDNVVLLGNGRMITVVAYAPGLARVTASLAGRMAACDVLVQTSTGNTNAYITSYTSALTVDSGEDKQLSVELVNGTEREQQRLLWTVENPAIVSLMGQGSTALITGQNGGETRISVYHPEDTSLFYNFYVRVNTLFTSISLNKTGIILRPGEVTNISAEIINGDGNDYQNLIWSTPPNALGIVTLIGNGKAVSVLANREGFVMINASLPGNIIAYCDVLVTENTGAGEVTQYITSPRTTVSVDLDNDIVLTASLVNGSPIEQNNLQWESSDNTVLQIIGIGNSVIASPVAVGTANVTISHPDAINEFTICVRVEDIYSTLSLNVTGLFLDIGDDYLLRAVCSGTTIDFNSISWTTEPLNQDIIMILGNGESVTIIGNNPGTVNVTASTISGSTASCEVMVREPKSLSVSPSIIAMQTGDQQIVYINKTPADMPVSVICTNPSVINCAYNEADSSIAVTAAMEGTASIQVAGGGLSAQVSCVVTVDRYFDVSTQLLNLEPCHTASFTYTIQPVSEQVAWTITNPDLASFTVNTGTQTVTITGRQEGSTTITGRTENGISRFVTLNIWYNSIEIEYSDAIVGGDNDSTDALNYTYLNETNSRIYCGDRVRLQIELEFPQDGLLINGSIDWTTSADFNDDLQLDIFDSGKRINLYYTPDFTWFDNYYDGGLLTFEVEYGNNSRYSRTFSIYLFAENG